MAFFLPLSAHFQPTTRRTAGRSLAKYLAQLFAQGDFYKRCSHNSCCFCYISACFAVIFHPGRHRHPAPGKTLTPFRRALFNQSSILPTRRSATICDRILSSYKLLILPLVDVSTIWPFCCELLYSPLIVIFSCGVAYISIYTLLWHISICSVCN